MNPSPLTNVPISSEHAQTILQPHLDIIGSCFTDAWDRWKQLEADPRGLGKSLTERTRASFVHDHIWILISERLLGKAGVREYQRKGLRTVVIAEMVTLRFKKFKDSLLTTSNIPTHQQERLALQLPLEGMEAYAPLVHLTTGYVLDRIRANIEDVRVTCSVDKAVAWSFQVPWITVPASGTSFTIEPLSPIDSAPVRTRRVRAKQSEQNDERQTGT